MHLADNGNTDVEINSQYMKICVERGFFHQCSHTDKLDGDLDESLVIGYIGFDCTAKSFHIGNLIQIMRMYWLQRCGHQPIVLMGGGTTKIGDPSGKDQTRLMLSESQILDNMDSLNETFAKFIRFGDRGSDAIMVNNNDWIKEMSYFDLLLEVGPHFSVNKMLTMDTVSRRLDREQELSFIEFNYMLLQAYDFVKLKEKYNCSLQMGGSDQWGNIISGVELGKKMGLSQMYALTCPLITTANGAKMGKTAKGAVWLKDTMLPAEKYWEYWRNVEDADVGKFLRLFTTISIEKSKEFDDVKNSDFEEGKNLLADEATKLLHG